MAEGAAARGDGFDLVKRVLLGRRMHSGRALHELLPKTLALPVLSADALSSVAYTVEATLVVLLAASLQSRQYVVPISLAVALLMAIVITSYRQTVRAYSTSGGAYVVAKDNLGTLPALVASSALLVGYVLTVAVSVVAGVVAITSVAHGLIPYKVPLSLFFVGLITVMNLRGLRESGFLFAIPTYGFIVAAFLLIIVGVARCLGDCPKAVAPDQVIAGELEVDLLVILQAFAVGSSALTGVEAISNAVTIFRRPQGRNAAATLAVLGAIAIMLVLGIAFLANKMDATPSHSVSLLSSIGRAAFTTDAGVHWMFYVIQAFTFAILVLAANTSFQGFPRLAAMMARDGFLPRQFENLGDRLVFSNGMIALAVLSGLLIWAFDANVGELIPLYAVGVFTAFTLSQAGMVRYWQRRGNGPDPPGAWQRSMVINATGASATLLIVAIIVQARFKEGVWVVLAGIPLMILGFRAIHRHYETVTEHLRVRAEPMAGTAAVGRDAEPPRPDNTVVLVVQDLDEATAEAVGYVRSFAGRDLRAVALPANGSAADLAARWPEFSRVSAGLEALSGRGEAGAVLEYIRSIPRGEDGFVTVVIPELFTQTSLVSAVRHRTSFQLKLRLLAEPQVVVTDVPVVRDPSGEPDLRPLIPARTEALLFVSEVHAATIRAARYARALRADRTRAVFFAMEAGDVERVQADWLEARIPMELDIVEAPFRDLEPPMLDEVRRITGRPGSLVSAIVPELVVRTWWHHLLHNQRALFIKRLLLFEPRVVLSSASYRIG